MADNFIDEKKVPENLTPIDVPATVPGRAPLGAPAPPIPHNMPQFFSGSMPPSLQHDVSFVGTEVGTPRIDKYSLMPFGNQANPFTNAAAQSAVIQTGGSSTPVAPSTDVESIATNLQTGTNYTVQVSDLDTLISISNSSPGTVILPGPPGGSFAHVQTVNFNASAMSATTTITNTAGNLMVLSVKTSDGGLTYPTVVDSNGNTWRKITVVLDGGNIPTSLWYAYNIAGGSNTIVVTNISTSSFCLPTVSEYSGFSSADPLDAFADYTDAVGTLTTVATNCAIYSAINWGTVSNPTSPAGWTQRFTNTEQLVQDRLAPLAATTVTVDSVPTVAGGDTASVAASFKTTNGPNFSRFPSGWFTYIENRGTGIVMVTSAALIDGSSSAISLPPNTGILVVFNGVGWYTMRGVPPGVLPQGFTLVSNEFLTSYNAATGLFTAAKAAFIGLSDTPASYSGSGNFEVDVNSGATALVFNPRPYVVCAFAGGTYTNSQIILAYPVDRAVTFAANFSGSKATLTAAVTASTTFLVQKNGSTIGTIVFASGTTATSFTTSGGTAQTFAAGDILSVLGPASADATAAGLGFSLQGTR
jgi:hypothetical protein